MRQQDRADGVGEPRPFDPIHPPLFSEPDAWRSLPPATGLLRVGLLVTAGTITYSSMLALQAYWPASPAPSPSRVPTPSKQSGRAAATAEPVLPEVRIAAPRLPASSPIEQAAAPSRLVNRCVQTGKVTYSNARCPQAAVSMALYMRREDPPPRAPHPAVLALAQPVPQPAQQVVVMQPQLLAQAVPDRKALDALITQIDAEARQPLSGAWQDWLRERKVARDRQFELRCRHRPNV